MGRPREHDEGTRQALLEAAEALVAAGGVDAVTVRAVADAIGTSTRAVYSLFGSKEGLLRALSQRAFHVLFEGLDRLPETDDPAADLVDAGVLMYRRFVLEHPSLYRLAFQRIWPGLQVDEEFAATRMRTWLKLEHRLRRLADAGGLYHDDVRRAAVEFNVMCEGLAAAELRGGTLRDAESERVWRDAFTSLVRGFRPSA